MTNRDIVLFLGAGFSCAAGLPTMKGFGKASHEEILSEIRDWLPNMSRIEWINFFTQKGEIYTGFKNYCEKAGRFVSIDSNNMEEIFCMAEQYHACKINEIIIEYVDVITKEIKRVESQIDYLKAKKT